MIHIRLNGWWRLWIVLSICWAIAVTAAIAPPVDAFRSRVALVEFEDETGVKTKIRIALSRALTEDQVKEQIERGEIGSALSKDPNSYAVQPVTWPFDKYVNERAIPELKRTLILVIAPIIGTLLLGLALAWIRRGFNGDGV